jgi:hypothetical protein
MVVYLVYGRRHARLNTDTRLSADADVTRPGA